MLSLAVLSLIGVLFVLVYISLRYGLLAWWDLLSRKRRLHAYKERLWKLDLPHRIIRLSKPHQHISDLLLALGWRMKPNGFVLVSVGLGLIGIALGVLVFQSFRSVVVLLLVLGILPYLGLRMSLINRQMATRLEFLPAVELFYQCYLVSGCRHIRIALQKTVEERRLPGEVQAVFDQLYRNLSVKEDSEGSLRRFSLSFGHLWSDYFSSILKVALEEGNNVADNLKELISDMRKSQLANQMERHRLLEIRMANFAPVLFLTLFLGINFQLNPEGSYEYYFISAVGRGMLLNSVVLLFGSLLMGLYLSRRKM
jgi:Flp pilus assembly protein TadB